MKKAKKKGRNFAPYQQKINYQKNPTTRIKSRLKPPALCKNSSLFYILCKIKHFIILSNKAAKNPRKYALFCVFLITSPSKKW